MNANDIELPEPKYLGTKVDIPNAIPDLYTSDQVRAAIEADRNRRGESAMRVGAWLSAALDDPNVCDEMKADIRTWMDAGMPTPQPADPVKE